MCGLCKVTTTPTGSARIPSTTAHQRYQHSAAEALRTKTIVYFEITGHHIHLFCQPDLRFPSASYNLLFSNSMGRFLSIFAIAALPLAFANDHRAPTKTTTSPTHATALCPSSPTPTVGQPCTGKSAFCVGENFIAPCEHGTIGKSCSIHHLPYYLKLMTSLIHCAYSIRKLFNKFRIYDSAFRRYL